MFGLTDEGEPEPVATPARVEIWHPDKLIDFLEQCRARVDFTTGSPRLVFPDEVPQHVRDEVTPHLAPNRGYLIDHFGGAGTREERIARRAQRRRQRANGELDRETVNQTRKAIIDAAREQARASGLPLWFLKRSGKPVGETAKEESKIVRAPWKRKIVVPIEREATHVSVGGEPWQTLPKVTTDEEDLVFRAGNGEKAKRKGKEYRDH